MFSSVFHQQMLTITITNDHLWFRNNNIHTLIVTSKSSRQMFVVAPRGVAPRGVARNRSKTTWRNFLAYHVIYSFFLLAFSLLSFFFHPLKYPWRQQHSFAVTCLWTAYGQEVPLLRQGQFLLFSLTSLQGLGSDHIRSEPTDDHARPPVVQSFIQKKRSRISRFSDDLVCLCYVYIGWPKKTKHVESQL